MDRQKGKYTRNPSGRSDYLRWVVFERDSYTCVLCRGRACDLHHVITRAQGGRDTPDNLVSLCRFHHLAAHGQRVDGIELTAEEIEQAIFEYMADYQAGLPYGWR